jgi:hypothetical protein
MGAIKALRVIAPKGIRVPEGTSPAEAELADTAMQRIVDVVMGKVHPSFAPSVLKGSTVIREEICGPIVKKIEVRQSLESMLTESMAEDPSDTDPDH